MPLQWHFIKSAALALARIVDQCCNLNSPRLQLIINLMRSIGLKQVFLKRYDLNPFIVKFFAYLPQALVGAGYENEVITIICKEPCQFVTYAACTAGDERVLPFITIVICHKFF